MRKVKIIATALTLSVTGLLAIQKYENGPEGPSTTAYVDAVGVPTICTGSTKNVFIPQTATLKECEERLQEDTTYAGVAVRKYVQVPLTQEQYDSLVSFTFNCGAGALKKSTLLKKLNTGDYCGAGHEFYRWDKAAGKRLRGLTKRRAAEAVPFIEECK